MGQTPLSLLTMLPSTIVPEAAKSDMRHTDAKIAPEPGMRGDIAHGSLFSKFMKRRDDSGNTSVVSRAAAPRDAVGKGQTIRHTAKPAEGKSSPTDPTDAASGQQTQEDDSDTDIANDAASGGESAEVSGNETSADGAEAHAKNEADTPESHTDIRNDTQPDANTESMLLGFFVGQGLVVPLPVSGDSADAAIVGTATSAPAPIPVLSDALSPLPPASETPTDTGEFAQAMVAAPVAAETMAVPAQNDAIAPVAPLAVSAATSAPGLKSAAAPSSASSSGSAPPTPASSEDTIPQDAAPAMENAPFVMPRRLGRQESVPPAASPPAQNTAAPVALQILPPARIATELAAQQAAEKSSVEDAVTAIDAPIDIDGIGYTPAAPAPAGPTSSGSKFELLPTGTAPAADQILAHVASLPKGRGTQFSLQLEPLHLGKVEVVMSIMHDGSLHMQIQAENREALASLQRDASQLERSLQDLGLKTDSNSLQFSLKQEGQPQQAFTPFADGAQRRSASVSPTSPGGSEAATPIRTIAYRPVQADGLDIHV